jgi:hypothetical protein
MSLKKYLMFLLACVSFAILPCYGNLNSGKIEKVQIEEEENLLSYAKTKVSNIAKVLTYTICFIGTSYAAKGIIKSISDAINTYLMKKVKRDMYKCSIQARENRKTRLANTTFFPNFYTNVLKKIEAAGETNWDKELQSQ